MAPGYVTSILGETRMVMRTWADGSHECPFCGYAVHLGICENPMCSASKWANEANKRHFVEMAEKADAARKAEAERKRNHELAMRRIDRERVAVAAARAQWRERVIAASACFACSDQYRGKIRKHRGECPKGRR